MSSKAHEPIVCYRDRTDTLYDYAKRSIADDELIEWVANLLSAVRELSGAYADVLLKTGEPIDKEIEDTVRRMYFGYFEHPRWRDLMVREYSKEGE